METVSAVLFAEASAALGRLQGRRPLLFGRHLFNICQTKGVTLWRSRNQPASTPVGRVGGAVLKFSRISAPRVQHALTVLGAKGVLGQGASKKISARIDPGLLEAARAKMGVITTRTS